MRKTAKYVGCIATLEIAGDEKVSAIKPICEFIEGDNVITRTSSISVVECRYQNGDEVQVDVDEQDPDSFMIVGTVLSPTVKDVVKTEETTEADDTDKTDKAYADSKFNVVGLFLLLFVILILFVVVGTTTDMGFPSNSPSMYPFLN